MDDQTVMRDYRNAYRMAIGRSLQITYHRGWYDVYSGGLVSAKYRRSQILEMTERLRARAIASGEGE